MLSVFTFVTSFPLLLLARSLQGLASSCISVAGMGMVALMYEEDDIRSQKLGFVMSGIATGVLIGYPMGGILFDLIGESLPFLLTAIVSTIVLGEKSNLRSKCF